MRFCSACGNDLRKNNTPLEGEEISPSDSGEIGPGINPQPMATELVPGLLVAGRYLLERKVGEGGMGVVWLANDQRAERPVAVKFIHPLLLENKEVILRFFREANICLDLTHRNIVRVYHLNQWNGHIYMTMEYLPGVTMGGALAHYRRTKRTVGWKSFSILLRQILEGIAYAHGKRIIHRDLKPNNIMMASDGEKNYRPVIMDFGVAKKLDSDGMTLLRASFGTAYYMAPEQIAGSGPIDCRSDIFSLGAIAYELLTCRHVTGHLTPPSVLRNDLPSGIDDWVFKALEPDPAMRFDSVQVMHDTLEDLIHPAKDDSIPANADGTVETSNETALPEAQTTPDTQSTGSNKKSDSSGVDLDYSTVKIGQTPSGMTFAPNAGRC